jgi:hypothetical protein
MRIILLMLSLSFTCQSFAADERTFYLDEDNFMSRKLSRFLEQEMGYIPVENKDEADLLVSVSHMRYFHGRTTSITVRDREGYRLYHAAARDSKMLLERTSRSKVLEELARVMPPAGESAPRNN